MGPLPPVSPLPSCQNVIFGGIIPNIAQNNFGKKNDLFWVFMNMNIEITDKQLTTFLKRRFSVEDLKGIVNDVKEMIDGGESVENAVYDGIRDLIKSKRFPDIDEFGDDQSYWNSYLMYERPLVSYVKMKLGLE
jgi:hypothetical protein